MGNILAFTASGRANAVSTQLVQLAVKIAIANGHRVEVIDLTACDLSCCKGCGHCRTRLDCSINDDFPKKIAACDGIIFGTPIYFSGIAGQAKIWLDRLYPMIDGRFIPRHPGKKVLAIYTQGDGNANMFLPAIRSTNFVFHMCGWSLIDSIVCAGTSSADFSIPEAITNRIRSAAEQF